MDFVLLHAHICCGSCESPYEACPSSAVSPSSQILCTIAGGSRGISYIYGGRVISGVGIGGISAVAPACVSECLPKNVHGRITGLFQIMVAIGVMLSYFINCEFESFFSSDYHFSSLS